jgi:hypothetical protein
MRLPRLAAGCCRTTGKIVTTGAASCTQDAADLREEALRTPEGSRQPREAGLTPIPPASLLVYAATANRRMSAASSPLHSIGPSPVLR